MRNVKSMQSYCGELVEGLRTSLGLSKELIHQAGFCTLFVRSMWVTFSYCAPFVRGLYTAIFGTFLSVAAYLYPSSTHPTIKTSFTYSI